MYWIMSGMKVVVECRVGVLQMIMTIDGSSLKISKL